MSSEQIAGRLRAHADVKPPNTFLSQRTSGQTFHLGIFGLQLDLELQQVELNRAKPSFRLEDRRKIGRPAWKPFRALSTDERAGGSWRDS